MISSTICSRRLPCDERFARAARAPARPPRADGGAVELLLLQDKGRRRLGMPQPSGRKLHPGAELSFGDGVLTATVTAEEEGGNRLVQFHYEGIFLELLERLGKMPLPPYIREELADGERYQTVYSRVTGSAAAPTAGLHFTKELLQRIADKGVMLAYITLHVGPRDVPPRQGRRDHGAPYAQRVLHALRRDGRGAQTARGRTAAASSASARHPAGRWNRWPSRTARSRKRAPGRISSSTPAIDSVRWTRSSPISICRRARSSCWCPPLRL